MDLTLFFSLTSFRIIFFIFENDIHVALKMSFVFILLSLHSSYLVLSRLPGLVSDINLEKLSVITISDMSFLSFFSFQYSHYAYIVPWIFYSIVCFFPTFKNSTDTPT